MNDQQVLAGLGSALALYGNTLVTGQAEGVDVFTRNRAGIWTQSILPPPPGGPYVVGGRSYRWAPTSVSVSKDLIAVGHTWFYGSNMPGQAYIYQLATLNPKAVEVPRPRDAAKEFGQAVHVSDAFLALGDGKKVFIWALTPGKPKKLASKAPQATIPVVVPDGFTASFAMWGSTLAVPSGNDTIVYEYNETTKKWVQRAKIKVAGPMALHSDTLVFSSTGEKVINPEEHSSNVPYLNLTVYKRDAAGKWTLAQEYQETLAEQVNDSWWQCSAPALDSETLVVGTTKITSMEGKRTGYFQDHKIGIYTKSGPGGAWARAAAYERSEFDHSLGTEDKVVAGDIIASGAVLEVEEDNNLGQGYVLVLSKKRELALAAAAS